MISLLTLISFESNRGVNCRPLNLSLEIEILDKWFIKGKLGYIKCLDYVKEKEIAIELLEEILNIAQSKHNYQE